AVAAGAVVERHPTAKDATDLELALLAARDRGAAEIVVVGGHGGGLDPLPAHLLLPRAAGACGGRAWGRLPAATPPGRREPAAPRPSRSCATTPSWRAPPVRSAPCCPSAARPKASAPNDCGSHSSGRLCSPVRPAASATSSSPPRPP